MLPIQIPAEDLADLERLRVEHRDAGELRELAAALLAENRVLREREAVWEASCERIAKAVLMLQRHAVGIAEACESVTTVLTRMEPNGRPDG